MTINVVLVRTIYPSNVGSVARVIGNMGASRLILVNPQCEIEQKAHSSAAGAQKWLEDKTEYASMEQLFSAEGEGIRIALTRRNGKTRTTRVITQVIEIIKNSENKFENIYLFFGPEDNGLDAEELEMMNYCCSLPVPGEFKSMNLSHAVLLTLHLVNTLKMKSVSPSNNHQVTPVYFPEDTIKEWINAMGFDWKKRRQSALGTIKKVLLNSAMSNKQLKSVEEILKQSIRKMDHNKREKINKDQI